MKRRLLACILALALCLSMLPTIAAAEDTSQLWFRTMEETESGTYAVTDTYLSALSLTFEEELFGVFYYGTLESREPVEEEELSHSSTVRIRALTASFVTDTALARYATGINLRGVGNEYSIKYEDTTLPITPVLPDVGLYKTENRDLDNYLYETVGYGPTSYLLLDEGYTIKEIIMDEGEDCSFLHFALSADKTMATLTMTEGFSTTARYHLTIVYDTADGEEKVYYLSFQVEDLSTPFLKAYHLNRTNNVNWVDYSSSELSIEGALDDNDRWAVYFVNGYAETPVALSDLSFPSSVEVQQQEEHESFFRLYYIAPTGSTPSYIEYTFDGNVYQLPITIDLPRFAFYTEPTASIDYFVGSKLPFEGSRTDENGVYEEYYLVSREGDTITGIEYEDGEDMSFLTYAEPDGTSASVKFTIREEFESDHNYSFQVFYGENDDEWVNLSIQDMRSQLFFDSTSRQNNLHTERTNIRFRKEETIEFGTSSTFIFYYGTQTSFHKVPIDQLTVSANLEKEKTAETKVASGLYGYVGSIAGIGFGTGTVSYTVDGKTYSVTFQVDLPRFGIYSASSASESSYLEELVYDGTDDVETFYVICTDSSYSINDISCEDAEDFMTFAEVSDTCWELNLSKGFASDEEYRVEVTYLDEDRKEWDDTLWIRMLDESPSLSFRRLVWDGEQYTAGSAATTRYSESLSTTTPIRGVFYYGPETNPQPVMVNALTFNGVTATSWSDEDLATALAGYAVELSSDQVGTATVAYEGLTFVISINEREYEGEPGYDGTGFYTSLDKDACFKVEDASGFPGDPVDLFFLWEADDDGNLPYKITVTLEAQKERTVFEDLDISHDTTIAALKDYDIYLTVEDDYIRVKTTIGNPRTLYLITHYADDSHEEALDLNLKYYQWGHRQENPTITIDGEEYTFGIGSIEEDEYLSILGAGSGFGGWDPYFVIFTDYGTRKEQPVSADEYNKIMQSIENLRFTITDYYNLVGTQEECNLSLSAIKYLQWNGYNLPYVEVITTRGMGVEAKMEVTFTYKGEDYCIVYLPCEGVALQDRFYVDASDLDTAEELNTILSSKNALMSWFEEKDPAAYNTYKTNFATGMIEMAEIILDLPAVKYTDIITVSVPGVDLTLRGHTNGTTMPGLRILRNRYPVYVENIDFIADEDRTHAYDNDTFTCGVLAARANDINSSAAGDARIMDCTFTGFDYGVRSTEGGYATLNGPCQFIDCEVGYLLDCEGKQGGNGSEGMEECIFANCVTAVRIDSLPEDFATYYWRILHCDFINNHYDLDVSAPGNFYFFRNYFGHFDNGVHSLDDLDDLSDIVYQKPQIDSSNDSTVFTNPRRVSPYNILDGRKNTTLCVDNGRKTLDGEIILTDNYIPNDEADDLVMDTALLSEEIADSGESISLSVIEANDDEEEILATWTIN